MYFLEYFKAKYFYQRFLFGKIFISTLFHLETIPAHSFKRSLLADPRSAGPLLSVLPQSSLHTTVQSSRSMTFTSHQLLIFTVIDSVQHSRLQLYEVNRKSENPSLTGSCECVCSGNNFDSTVYIHTGYHVSNYCSSSCFSRPRYSHDNFLFSRKHY